MKLRMLGMLLAVVVLAPAGARGQVPPCCSPLSTTLVDRMIPLLQGEAMGSKGLNDRLAQRGMTKQEYVALKNALMVARLDASDAHRLTALPFDDGSRSVRQANVAVFRANATRLNAALAGVKADPACGLCVPAVPTPAAKRKA